MRLADDTRMVSTSMRPLFVSAVLLLACTDNKLGAGDTQDIDTTSTDPATTTEPTTASATDGPESGTGDPSQQPEACLLESSDWSELYSTNAQTDEIDETCTVVTSEVVGATLELVLDCPMYAAIAPGGPLTFTLESGPLPATPQVGTSLAVFYQHADDQGFMDPIQPGMLFLRADDVLLYGVVRGYFIDDSGHELVEQRAAPLGVAVVAGACSFLWTGWDGTGDGSLCKYSAVSRVELQGDTVLTLDEGQTADLMLGTHAYTAHLRMARRNIECVDLDASTVYWLQVARQ